MGHSIVWPVGASPCCQRFLKTSPFLRQTHCLACYPRSQGLELKSGHFSLLLHFLQVGTLWLGTALWCTKHLRRLMRKFAFRKHLPLTGTDWRMLPSGPRTVWPDWVLKTVSLQGQIGYWLHRHRSSRLNQFAVVKKDRSPWSQFDSQISLLQLSSWNSWQLSNR